MNFDLLQYLFTLGILYIYGRLILHYGLIFIHFMLDQGMVWKSQFEKPRILFLLTGLVFMHLMLYAQGTFNGENHLLQSITIAVFSAALFFSQMAWTDEFEGHLLKPKKSGQHKKGRNFNLRISEVQMQKLYDDLVRFDLVRRDKTSLEDFINVLTKNWDTHNSRIYFKMDSPSCREFYDYLVKAFPHNDLTLKSFFDSSKLILRPDGRSYKYNTVKNAPTKCSFSKKHSDLEEIFQKINN
ncbi:MAG: hypothetical protein ABJ092_15560 [Gillisia sp.]